MRKKSPSEMEKSRIQKTARSLIRLKHSLAADEEINEVLPETLAEFEEALASGDLKQLVVNVSELLEGSLAPGK